MSQRAVRPGSADSCAAPARHSVSSPWEALQPSVRRRTSLASSVGRHSVLSADDSLDLGFRRGSRGPGSESCRRASNCSIASLASTDSTGQPPLVEGQNLLATEDAIPRGERCIILLRNFVQSNAFSAFMFMLSFFVLFGDDLRLALFTMEADPVFNSITLVSIFLFTFELVITSIAVDDYFLSFFFLLDIISTVSLILDLTYVWEYLNGYESVLTSGTSAGGGAADQSDYARAGRSSRLGTRVARILRVFRLIRMARMVKIVSVQKQKRIRRRSLSEQNGLKRNLEGRARGSEDAEPGEATEGADDLVSSESRVGKKLSEKTTLWVIVLVLAMLLVVPLLDPGESEAMMVSSAQYGAEVIYQAWQDLLASGYSRHRRVAWEEEVLMYTYYHNYYAECPDVEGDKGDCASDALFKLCFLGYIVDDRDTSIHPSSLGYIRELSLNSTDWDRIFVGREGDWRSLKYIVGKLPEDVKEQMSRPWLTDCRIPQASVYGVSLIRGKPCPWRTLRPQEVLSFLPSIARFSAQDRPAEAATLLLLFDVSRRSISEAAMSMIRTVFIIIALTMGALMFSTDADNLVLHPIERMIHKVELIRQNPLYAIKLGDEQWRAQFDKEPGTVKTRSFRSCFRSFLQAVQAHFYGQQQELARPGRRMQRSRSIVGRKEIREKKEKRETMETKILENTIIKLGSLLALGFGEAGSEIIGHNLDDDNVGVDAMIPGRKVEAIYGYCQIKDFTITTEVLQEKTMVFVNQVAEIVHRIVDEHLGAANKNVGEAFLLVWRVGLYEAELRPKIAELSVMSFIQILAATNRDRQLAEYREHPALLARCHKYRVSLGFGLHLGWSIEGAIGSEFKIDASYLSSHVNMAMCLETVTKQYGVMILMSEALVRACTKSLAYYFRAIDNVKLQGAKTPTRLFTVDLDCCALFVETENRMRTDSSKYKSRQHRELLKLEKLDHSYRVHDIFASDRHIKRMRSVYFLEFFQEFEKGYLNYEAGEWDVAAAVFRETSVMLKDLTDGPSCALLDYMCALGFEAPPRWPGYRELSDRPLQIDGGAPHGITSM